MIHLGINLHAANMMNAVVNDNAEVVREANLPTGIKASDDFSNVFDEPVLTTA